ncbi:MAG: hypothetical protein JXB62_11370 [Pirellulales bacterium]|nr:hypothetical protein [Pirellulales bacterium]
MLDWIEAHETILWWLAAASAIMFVATLILVPLVVVRIPADYFAPGRPHRTPWTDQHPIVRGFLLVAKNLLGCVFVGAGLLMLALPGQGILTIVVGIMLLNFPGKYRLERWIVARRPVLRSANWLRQRAEKAPLVLDV